MKLNEQGAGRKDNYH